jgi:hypothetical protein
MAVTALDLILSDSFEWNWYLRECCAQAWQEGRRISLHCYTRSPELN